MPAALETPGVRQALCDWDEFKRAKRQGYKSTHGWKEMLNEFGPLGPEILQASIKHAIKNNYTGVFPRFPDRNGGSNGRAPTRDELAREAFAQAAEIQSQLALTAPEKI